MLRLPGTGVKACARESGVYPAATRWSWRSAWDSGCPIRVTTASQWQSMYWPRWAQESKPASVPARTLRPVLYCGAVPLWYGTRYSDHKDGSMSREWTHTRKVLSQLRPATAGLYIGKLAVKSPQIMAQARTLLQQYPLHDDRFKIHMIHYLRET